MSAGNRYEEKCGLVRKRDYCGIISVDMFEKLFIQRLLLKVVNYYYKTEK